MSTYETTTTTTTSDNHSFGPDPFYVRSITGILKIVEMILCLIAFICACVKPWFAEIGGGWVQFVTISAFIGVMILFLLHFLRIMPRLPGPWLLIEFIYYVAYVVMLLIAGIVSATKANWHGSIAAACVFTFAATAVFAVETFLIFRDWQSSRVPTAAASSSTTTTTTVTTASYDTKTQY